MQQWMRAQFAAQIFAHIRVSDLERGHVDMDYSVRTALQAADLIIEECGLKYTEIRASAARPCQAPPMIPTDVMLSAGSRYVDHHPDEHGGKNQDCNHMWQAMYEAWLDDTDPQQAF